MRSEFLTSGPNAKAFFGLLEMQSAEIHDALGIELTWVNPAGSQQCRMYVAREIDFHDRNAWPEHREWLRENAEGFSTVLGPPC